MQKVGLYARCSTKLQDCTGQLEELRKFATLRGWEISEYVDAGVSGAKESRPELNRMLSDARAGHLSCICVVKLDRLGRSLKHLINLMAELGTLKVGFVSVRDNIDLTTSIGQLVFSIMGAVAEFERSLIRERVQAGVNHARAKGIKFGPGFKFDRSELVRLSQTMSNSQLAKHFGVSRQAILQAKHSLESIVRPSHGV